MVLYRTNNQFCSWNSHLKIKYLFVAEKLMKSLVQRYGKHTDVYVDNDTKSINIYFNSDFNTEELS